MKSILKNYVEEALEKRLEEKNFTDSKQLLGDCYYNTKCLSNVLTENDIEHSVFCGGLAGDYREDNIPENFQEARKIGLVHYWVESHGYICEISGECSLGEPIVISNRPQDYIVFEDSKYDSLPNFNG